VKFGGEEGKATVNEIIADPNTGSVLKSKLGDRTRLVAVGAASNAVGTINPIREVADLAHAAGAQVFVDAVHYAPHAPIDVEAWDCDFVS